jgi:hypothetical protein
MMYGRFPDDSRLVPKTKVIIALHLLAVLLWVSMPQFPCLSFSSVNWMQGVVVRIQSANTNTP